MIDDVVIPLCDGMIGEGGEGQFEAFERNHDAFFDISCKGLWGRLLQDKCLVEELLLPLLVALSLLLEDSVWLPADKPLHLFDIPLD